MKELRVFARMSFKATARLFTTPIFQASSHAVSGEVPPKHDCIFTPDTPPAIAAIVLNYVFQQTQVTRSTVVIVGRLLPIRWSGYG